MNWCDTFSNFHCLPKCYECVLTILCCLFCTIHLIQRQSGHCTRMFTRDYVIVFNSEFYRSRLSDALKVCVVHPKVTIV